MVYGHNGPAFELWCQVWRQWRWVAGGMDARRVGLDWCQVEAVMRMQGIKRRKRAGLLKDLRLMEGAALEELAQIAQERGG